MIFDFFPPARIKVKGWLLRQLNQQGEGLNGNLDKVWADVRDSKWLGGTADGWERLPYFLDGFIPLAYLLGDADKIARAEQYAKRLLESQAEDGCFYPKGDREQKQEDIWSLFLILKVLTVYADCSQDRGAEDAVYRGLRFIDTYIGYNPPFHWAAARWFECLVPVLWLYRRRKEAWLLRLARRLRVHGLDYKEAIPLWDTARDEWNYETHVVNIAMALKSEALWCELTGEPFTGLAEEMLKQLFGKHGTAYGHFTGDECLSGTSPSQGSELCGIVEAMYSYEWLSAVTGEAKWGDLLESLAFNGLPAAISADMWTHQYDQQVNQIACADFHNPIFRTNGAQANMFGLEPHFGCCTANFGQGWPKFALSCYLRQEKRLVVLSPVPAEIEIGEGRERNRVVCDSEYPFRTQFSFRAERDIDLLIRIPSWTTPTCSAPYTFRNGWLSVRLEGGKELTVNFPAQPRLEPRFGERYCLKYGALLFSLPVEGERIRREYTRNGVERKFPYCDYEILPTGEWRYAFASEKFTVREEDYALPFDRAHPPLKIQSEFAPVEWSYERDHDLVAAETAGTKRRGGNVTLTMQPYGATDLRMTEMAFVKNHIGEETT